MLLKEISLMSISEEAAFEMGFITGYIACNGIIVNMQVAKTLPESLLNRVLSSLEENADKIK